MIASARSVAEFLPLLEQHTRIAVDTEADSLHCYREKLCLLQVSVAEGDFLVDPLAGVDLNSLAKLLARKELVLHGADYDLRLLRRGLNLRPKRIFDTSLAARLVGIREFSYAALVKKYFGVELPKGSQKANWALRPLSSRMAAYARNDTHYLLPLAGKLEAQLRDCGRLEWFEQSCQRAITLAAVDRERDLEDAWRVRGAGVIRGREAAVLRALWNWREAEAQRLDRPSFHILRNDQLIAAAAAAVRGNLPSFRHFSERRAREFRAAAESGLRLEEKDWPQITRGRRERPTLEMQRMAEKMRRRRDHAARELGMDPSFIAPRATIEAIAADGKSAAELLTPWQQKLLDL